MSVTIREATPADASLIYGFIRALAEYEKLLDQVEASEADLAGHLFCETPRLFCDIAEGDGTSKKQAEMAAALEAWTILSTTSSPQR